MIRSLLLTILLAAMGCRAGQKSQALPFFGSPELTPHWGISAAEQHRISPFTLIDQKGRRFDSGRLQGKIYVASFIYTSCAGICPPMVTHLLKVQSEILSDPEVEIVSFSVTPETDSAEALDQFGAMRGVVPGKWHLLTGDREEIYELARSSYFADRGGESDSSAFLHTESFFLLDGRGRIRGVYNGTRAFDVERLLEDIAVLKNT